MTQPKDTSELVAELRSLMERATRGTWSWEDNPPTVYAGRVDPMGEFAGMPICGHGYNLFGRLTDISHNGRADLDLAVAAVNALPTLLDELVNAYRIIGEMREALTDIRRLCDDHFDPSRFYEIEARADAALNPSREQSGRVTSTA